MNEMEHMAWFFERTNKAAVEGSWLTCSAQEVLTPEECQRIIDIGKSFGLKRAQLGDGTNNDSVRPSSVCFMPVCDETQWIYEKLERFVENVNDGFFQYELTGFAESIQFTEYKEPGGKYDAHIDRMNIGSTVRKLSVSIQLSDPADYDGGELELFTNLSHPEVAPKQRGSAFIFNSMLLHRVAPVTRGTRYSLVIWVNGPRFR